MDFFKKMMSGEAKLDSPTPTVTDSLPRQPQEGGERQAYKVMGVWVKGKFVVPSITRLELSGGRRTERPGDVIELTRQEAAVVQKNFVLVPVEVLEA